MRTRFIIWAGLVMFVTVLTGCSSTTLKTSSKDGQFTRKVSKVYIIGFAYNPETRQQFENTAAGILTSHGAAGVASYQDQPALEEINDETIGESVKAIGADALLLTLAKERGTISAADIIGPNGYRYELIPRYQNYTYPQPYYRRYGTYDHVPRNNRPYSSYRKAAFSDFRSIDDPSRQIFHAPPGRHETIIMETYLFDTQTKKLMWSAELETKLGSTDTVITDFINTVTDDLKKQGLI